MHCKYCGYKLKRKDKTCPNCEDIFKEEDNDYSKKRHKFIPIMLIVVLLGVIIGGYYYINRFDVILNMVIKEVYKSASKEVNKYEQIKTNINMKINMDSNDSKEINDLVKDFNINTSINIDLKDNKALFGMGVDFKNKSLAKMDLYIEEKNVYFDLNDLFNKIIMVTEEELKKEDENVGAGLNITEEDMKVLLECEFNALKEALKYANYKSERVKIDDSKVNKNTIIINNENKNKIINKYIDYLLDNSEYIEIYARIYNISKEDAVKELNDSRDIDELKNDIYISLYTKMLTNEFIKLDVDLKEMVFISFEKVNEKEYKMDITDKDGVKTTTTITDNGNEEYTIVSTTINEGVLLTFTLDVSFEFNEKIQMPVTKKVIETSEITEDDINYIMGKLMENEAIIEIFNTVNSYFPNEINSGLGGIIL